MNERIIHDLWEQRLPDDARARIMAACRTEAEKKLANRETDKPLASMIPSEYRDQKAVKIAIARLHDGRYILHKEG